MDTDVAAQLALTVRAPLERVERQGRQVADVMLLGPILDAVPGVLVVVNQQHQIVFANRGLLAFLELEDRAQVRGQRLGEALNCVHAFESAGGCGTTETCRTCGAFQAIRAALAGRTIVEECHILRRSHRALELRVSAAPLAAGDDHLVVLAAQDISDEKRRRALERIFFHDLLNTAGALSGFASLLHEVQSDELTNGVYHLSQRLIDEIQSQRELAAAENAELQARPGEFDALDLVHETIDFYSRHEVASHRGLQLDPASRPVTLVSDRLLLGRVLGNMVKNALEASRPGEIATLRCGPCEDIVEFSVHNPAYMARQVQLQVFKRSFTTKGAGRGLGTYGMKLITEQYLHGRVWFQSTPSEGTTFWVAVPREWHDD